MGRSQPAAHSFVCLGVPERGQTGGPGRTPRAAAAGSTAQWGVGRQLGGARWAGVRASWGHGRPRGPWEWPSQKLLVKAGGAGEPAERRKWGGVGWGGGQGLKANLSPLLSPAALGAGREATRGSLTDVMPGKQGGGSWGGMTAGCPGSPPPRPSPPSAPLVSSERRPCAGPEPGTLGCFLCFSAQEWRQTSYLLWPETSCLPFLCAQDRVQGAGGR